MSFWHSYSWAISASRSYDISVDRSTFSILTHGVDEHAFVLPLSLASREMRVVQDVGASYWVMIPLQLCTMSVSTVVNVAFDELHKLPSYIDEWAGFGGEMSLKLSNDGGVDILWIEAKPLSFTLPDVDIHFIR
ncbi:hypothetical protein V6N13_125294 [Hibiscus sabdariffa]